mmetsp:Transcript_70528/g.187880  ORF Transcript_70528/g.187880 Transcript_70528/m.187880 type:complete len:345 (-) Transcript_70528:91-1125(-)
MGRGLNVWLCLHKFLTPDELDAKYSELSAQDLDPDTRAAVDNRYHELTSMRAYQLARMNKQGDKRRRGASLKRNPEKKGVYASAANGGFKRQSSREREREEKFNEAVKVAEKQLSKELDRWEWREKRIMEELAAEDRLLERRRKRCEEEADPGANPSDRRERKRRRKAEDEADKADLEAEAVEIAEAEAAAAAAAAEDAEREAARQTANGASGQGDDDGKGKPDREQIKELIAKIPTTKADLFEYPMNWNVIQDEGIVDRKLKPWVKKKVAEFLGEEDISMTSYILRKVELCNTAQPMLVPRTPDQLVADLKELLDDDAEEFVVKMWRMLIFEVLRAQLTSAAG